jgi:RHS repeat-associated protein
MAQYPVSPQDSIIYTYDAVGNMIRMVDFNDTINYSYDEMDNLDTLDCYQSVLISYEYDKNGNKKKLKEVNYSITDTVYLEQSFPSYDEANRLEKTIAGTDTFKFTYWDGGQIKKIEYPNGIKEQYKLTSRNFIDIVTDSTASVQLFKYDYHYNEVGDRDTMIFKVSQTGMASPKTGTVSYKYDDLRRITEAKYPLSIYNKTNKYTYDKVGNRLKKIAGTDTTEYVYNKRNNQLKTTDVPDTFTYDNNGNLTNHKLYPGPDEWKFTYDYKNMTTRIVKDHNTTPDTLDTLWFNYCGLGKRITKIEKLYNQNPDTTRYVYDGMYTVCELEGDMTLEYQYIYANGLLLARYEKSPSDTHYYHHDGLGSIIGMTDGNFLSPVERSYFYDEFGNVLDNWGTVSNNYLYTGQEFNSSISQLYNLRTRLYDMRIGRFLTEDPINSAKGKSCPISNDKRIPQELNNYLYTVNNPVNLIDPLGLKSCFIILSSGSVGIGHGIIGYGGINIEGGTFIVCCSKNSGPFECRRCAYICAGPSIGVGVPVGKTPFAISGGFQFEFGPWFGELPECGFAFQLSWMAMAGKGVAGSISGVPSFTNPGVGITGGGGAGVGAGISGMGCWSWEIGE